MYEHGATSRQRACSLPAWPRKISCQSRGNVSGHSESLTVPMQAKRRAYTVKEKSATDQFTSLSFSRVV
jgi:hypothetical protein